MRLARYAVLLSAVPLVGIVELVAHVVELRSVVPEENMVAARDAVARDLKPDDLVTFAPYWNDPIGRETFGDSIMTMKRAGRSDEARFPRAWEVSIRGEHDEALAKWKPVSEQRFGRVTVSLLENPEPVKVIDDLLDFIDGQHTVVTRIDQTGAESPCPFQHGASAGGSTVVPQGLLTPASKYLCASGSHVGITVLHALDHHPHVCINATPPVRLKFLGVRFGTSLVGHSGIQWMAERAPSRDTTTIDFKVNDRPVGLHTHRHGAGWVNFEFPTPELAGKRADLVADIGGSPQRMYCFEVTTRSAP